MKTLIFNGSPRKNGGTATLIHEFKKNLPGEINVVSAYQTNISPCVDCRYCWTDQEHRARVYPIILSEYNPAWPEWFAEEKVNLERMIGTENIACISHYGSTSIPGMTAKPTIDILLEIKETANIDKLIAALPSPEYICLSGAGLTMPTPPPHWCS